MTAPFSGDWWALVCLFSGAGVLCWWLIWSEARQERKEQRARRDQMDRLREDHCGRD